MSKGTWDDNGVEHHTDTAAGTHVQHCTAVVVGRKFPMHHRDGIVFYYFRTGNTGECHDGVSSLGYRNDMLVVAE